MVEAFQPVTVLTVDDQEVFRRTARSLIAATPGFEQVGEAASGAQALEMAADLQPDLVLLDVRMPGMDGIETACRLAEVVPGTMIVLVSLDPMSAPDPPECAAAYVRKQDLSAALLQDLWRGRGQPAAPAGAR
jgi:two-component system, NarL family, invasion response regulator UvrY